MFRKKMLFVLVLALLTIPIIFFLKRDADKPQNKSDGSQKSFDKTRHSTTTPGSLWWVVNKNRPLPEGYVPPDLVVPNMPVRGNGDEAQVSQKVVKDLESMVTAAKQSGFALMLVSGYRSYALQASVYNQNVRQLGQAEADKVSARPGTSEHQTGLALDLGPTSRQCEIEVCFGDLPEGKWLAQNAHKYGFIIRYPKGKEAMTGYTYEPWHFRYVGRDLATELHRTNQTMEEFFSL